MKIDISIFIRFSPAPSGLGQRRYLRNARPLAAPPALRQQLCRWRLWQQPLWSDGAAKPMPPLSRPNRQCPDPPAPICHVQPHRPALQWPCHHCRNTRPPVSVPVPAAFPIRNSPHKSPDYPAIFRGQPAASPHAAKQPRCQAGTQIPTKGDAVSVPNVWASRFGTWARRSASRRTLVLVFSEYFDAPRKTRLTVTFDTPVARVISVRFALVFLSMRSAHCLSYNGACLSLAMLSITIFLLAPPTQLHHG